MSQPLVTPESPDPETSFLPDPKDDPAPTREADPTPDPEPGPAPDPSPESGATPSPEGHTGSQANICGNPSICPDGCMNQLYKHNGGTNGIITIPGDYGYRSMRVPEGTTKTWCIPVGAPYVDTSRPLEKIEISVGGVPDTSCAHTDISLRQDFHPFADHGYTGTDGGRVQLRSGKQWRAPYDDREEFHLTPERAQFGVHVFSLSTTKVFNTTGYCANTFDHWRILWRVRHRGD